VTSRLRPAASTRLGRKAVPFVDLSETHRPIKADLLADFSALIDAGDFTNGPPVVAFERSFAAYCRIRHCVGLASGLDALRLGLRAAGLERGEEVVVPAQTFVATFEAVTQAGGVPVVVDIRPDDCTIDLDAARAALTGRTRVVLPVHLYGQMADMRAVARLACGKGLAAVEDACQGHGAERDGVHPGELSAAAAFSFYPGKNLGAMGDAGALVSNDGPLATRARALREHGQTTKYTHEEEGYTARLDTIQALVLLRKLPFLDRWNRMRAAAAAYYSSSLAGVGDLALPTQVPGSCHAWHLYVVRSAHAAALADFLGRRGVATGRHYPTPPHLCRAYSWLGHRSGSFPVAEALAREGLSLPLFPGIRQEQLAAVAAAVADFFRRG
jgi:dTDP-4-amino-4,6-dideoxygalactose transaminase